MEVSGKYYIKLFGIRLCKIKVINADYFEFYLFFLPLFTIRKNGRRININLLIVQKFYDSVKKNYKKIRAKQAKKQIIKRFQNGEKLKICFIVERPGTWCFDYLYKLLNEDGRFEVYIFIMPDPAYGYYATHDYIDAVYQELEAKGYSPIRGIDLETDNFFDLAKDINPDMVYFTDFGRWHYYPQYYITNFLDKITFLTDYGFSVMNDKFVCTFELNQLVDRYYRATDFHKTFAEQLMKNKGANVVVTGSPKLDVLFDKNYTYQDVWKPQNKPKKRIIWAPHHSNADNGYQNTDQWMMNGFMELCDFMLEVAERFKDEVQFVFRPHPILKSYLQKKWGDRMQQQYYDKWDKLENTQYYTGNFCDLFATSDAMIMDCLSFMAEYTAFDKPIFFTKTKNCRTPFNDFGAELYKNFYKPQTNLKEDIIKFIQEVVINGKDDKAAQRHLFVKQYFGKINGHTASENIYNDIIKLLEGEK